MTRPIKFRAFSTAVKQWYYSDDEAYVLKDIDGTLFLMEMENFYHHKNDIELSIIGEALQYTGLDDKNGREIYEGDIVRFEGSYDYPVRFDEGCFCTDAYSDLDPLYRFGNWQNKFNKMEVIGNTIENSELLETENNE